MRLIHARTYTLEDFISDSSIPHYAILSHTWETEEVSFRDIQDLTKAKLKRGFAKIKYACEQAIQDHLEYVWVDTCCIDKSSSAELQEAINSMYSWYKRAEICYAYLEDIMSSCPFIGASGRPIGTYTTTRGSYEDREFWEQIFHRSKWFTRGWTLQELIAPKKLDFFSNRWSYIGSRNFHSGATAFVARDSHFTENLSKATGIKYGVLQGTVELASISVADRMSWAARRHTSRIEDEAYCLLGIFDVNMPLLYGEGDKAFRRLQEEILKVSSDHSLFVWNSDDEAANSDVLARSPADFHGASGILPWGRPGPFEMTNRGLRLLVPLLAPEIGPSSAGTYLAVLNCRHEEDFTQTLALRLRRHQESNEFYVSHSESSRRLMLVDCEYTKLPERSLVMISKTVELENSQPLLWLRQQLDDKDIDLSKLVVASLPQGKWNKQLYVIPARLDQPNNSIMADVKLGTGYGTFVYLRFGVKMAGYLVAPGIWASEKDSPSHAWSEFRRLQNSCIHGAGCPSPQGTSCPHLPTTCVLNVNGSQWGTASISQEYVLGGEAFGVIIKKGQMEARTDSNSDSSSSSSDHKAKRFADFFRSSDRR